MGGRFGGTCAGDSPGSLPLLLDLEGARISAACLPAKGPDPRHHCLLATLCIVPDVLSKCRSQCKLIFYGTSAFLGRRPDDSTETSHRVPSPFLMHPAATPFRTTSRHLRGTS